MKLSNWISRTCESALAAFRRVRHWGRNAVKFVQAKPGWLLLIVLVVATAVGIWAVINYWDWLRGGSGSFESGSTTVRNVGLVIGGVVAILLAVWRSRVAERQASAAQRQADTARQTLLNERYQRGAEMLGSEVLAVRLGGIYALQSLAEEHPELYHIEIMKLFCAFVRDPTVRNGRDAPRTIAAAELGVEESGYDQPERLRFDVQSVVEAIATRNSACIALEDKAGFRLDLRNANLHSLDLFNLEGVNLSGARLTDVDLSHVKLRPFTDLSRIRESYQANFSKARLNRVSFEAANLEESSFRGSLLIGANLRIADLRRANLSTAVLANANLRGAELRDVKLSGTKFAVKDYPPARALTQAQLDLARADPDNPPKLDGVLDAVTGKQLVWRGEPCE